MVNADPDKTAAGDTPENRLLAMMLGVAGTQLIGLAAKLEIADLLNDGPKSIPALAEATGTKEQALLQTMRALVALGVFAEPQPHQFANTALGELLLTDAPNSLRGYAVMLAGGMMLRGWANLSHALRTNKGALDDALGMKFTPTFSRTRLRPLSSMRQCPRFPAKRAAPWLTPMTFHGLARWST
jgi:hypothetical protein